MNDGHLIEMLSTPNELAFEDIENTVLDVFFALGIVNPSGPTLTMVAAVGSAEIGQRLPVVKAVINPFSASVEQVAWYTVAKQWRPRTDLAALTRLDFGDCPTLVLVNKDIDSESRISFIAEILTNFGGQVAERLAAVKKYFGNPYDRVSMAMAGKLPAGDDALPISIASNLLAEVISKPEHIRTEMEAFAYAWDGSINRTGISESLKSTAMSYEKFNELFIGYICPTLFIPKVAQTVSEDNPEPIPAEPSFQFASHAEVREILRSGNWKEMTNADLAYLLQESIVLYGVENEHDDVPYISKLYALVLEKGITAEDRLKAENQIRAWQEKYGLPCIVFMPFFIEDTDRVVVAEATIDFVSTSPYVDEERTKLYALEEIGTLFDMGVIKNIGAVFGALVAMGEPSFWPLLDRIRATLTEEQAFEAVQSHTRTTSNMQVQYWIRWAKELITGQLQQPESFIPYPALALSARTSINAQKLGVYDGRRQFPYSEGNKDKFMADKRHWTFDEYAEYIAPQLYELEKLEPAPKLFSSVLRHWGLEPAAALGDQYIPESSADDLLPKRFRDLAE